MMKPAEMRWIEPTDAQREECVGWLMDDSEPEFEKFHDYLTDPFLKGAPFDVLLGIGPGHFQMMQLVWECLSQEQKERAVARLAPKWAELTRLAEQNRKTAALLAKRRRGRGHA